MRLLEEFAANAWPASIVQHVDGWRLRWGPEGTYRTRSVWPNDGSHGLPLADRLALAERFYAARDLPARFQISPAMQPFDLDARLAALGWIVEKPSQVLVAQDLAQMPRNQGAVPVVLESAPSPVWIAAYAALQGFSGAKLDERARLFARIGPACVYAHVTDARGALAAGFSVLERGWWGLYSLAVRSNARRRGIGATIVARIAEHCATRGASRGYLQVEADNPGALSLYARLGYRPHHAYHYRTAPARP